MFQLGLIGYPLGHSLSPGIHEAALKAMNLAGEYRLYPVEPLPTGEDHLVQVVGRIRHGELDGLNVTIPHKPSVVALLDGLTPTAAGIGAVNTIFREGSRLIGDNTDAPGFLADLDRLHVIEPGQALVLGAGGSARSVVYGLVQRGWEVKIAARRLAQAQSLADQLQSSAVTADTPRAATLSGSGLRDALSVDLIINTTPVGMTPILDANPWPSGLPLPQDAFVYDLIYNPAETLLLAAARSAGLKAANGLGMLVEQAALSLERWTGKQVPREAMWQALQEFIQASQAVWQNEERR